MNSGLAMAVLGASKANNAAGIQYAMSTALPNNDYMWFEWQGGSNWFRIKPLHANDVWEAEQVTSGGVWIGDQFRNVKSGKCLVVQGASLNNGAKLIQYNCEKGAGAPYNELWKVGNVTS